MLSKYRKKINSKSAKFLINLYPPFLFNRIKVLSITKDYMQVKVKIKKSFINKNMAGTLFGGTLFSAADPFIAIMYWQIFSIRFNQKIIVWLKSAEIVYKKPASTDMFLHFKLEEKNILEAKKALDQNGKYVSEYFVDLTNKQGEICAIVKLNSYLGIPN